MMFKSKLRTDKIDRRRWVLISPLVYDGSKKYVVPKGFETDGASIPRIAWWFCHPMDGNHAKPSVLHDYLCETSYNQPHTDKIFLEAMEANGVGWLKRTVMFNSVRLYQILKGKYFKNNGV